MVWVIWLGESLKCNLDDWKGLGKKGKQQCSVCFPFNQFFHTSISYNDSFRNFEELEGYISELKFNTQVNPKDTVEERLKPLKEQKERAREKRRQEREEKRRVAAELAQKKKGRSGRGRRSVKGVLFFYNILNGLWLYERLK